MHVLPNTATPVAQPIGREAVNETNNKSSLILPFQEMISPLKEILARKVTWAWSATLDALKSESIIITAVFLSVFAACGMTLAIQAGLVYTLAKFVIVAWKDRGAESTIVDLQQRNRELNTEIDRVIVERNQFRQEKYNLHGQNRLLRLDVVHLNENHTRLEQDKTNIQTDLQAMTADRDNVLVQVNLLRQQKEARIRRIQSMRTESGLLREQITTLEQQLALHIASKEAEKQRTHIVAPPDIQRIYQALSPYEQGLFAQLFEVKGN